MIYINRSDQCREELFRNQAEMAEDDDVAYYQLVKDSGILCNAVYYIIKRALKLRNAIDLCPTSQPNARPNSSMSLSILRFILRNFAHLLSHQIFSERIYKTP